MNGMNKHQMEGILRALERGNYEESGGGVLVPEVSLRIGGRFSVSVNGGPEEFSKNIVVTEGLNDLLSTYLDGGSQITAWYVGLFKGNVTPVNTWTAANVTANSTEATEYDEATRQAWSGGTAAAGSIDNLAAKAVFTINANITAYGAFLASASAKSATTGKLFAASRFATSRALIDDDVLNVGYTVAATST